MHEVLKNHFGRHFLVELIGCKVEKIRFLSDVRNAMLESARESSATVINDVFHQFSPHGVSGLILIAESHFSIHTWPESEYAAVGIFTCGTQMSPERAIEVLKEQFGAQELRISTYPRGF